MKKGDVRSQVIVFILMGLILVSVGVYFNKMYKGLDNQLEQIDCVAQIQTHSKILKLGRKIFLPINCPTTEHIYKKNTGGDEIKEDVAEEMRLCWKRWGKGEAELFADEGLYCHYCSYIDFRETKKDLEGLSSYLATENVPKGDETYLQYLTPTATIAYEEQAKKLKQSNDRFSYNEPYTVIFIYAKGNGAINKLQNYVQLKTTASQVAVGTGAVAGVFAGTVAAIFIGSNPVGWFVGAALATGGIVTWFVSSFDPNDYHDTFSGVLFMPLSKEEIKDLGCTHAWATIEKPEGFYTHKAIQTKYEK